MGYPWLYYERGYDKLITASPPRLKFRASFSYEDVKFGILKTLRFKLASFDLNGEFLGFQDLTNQLVACEESIQQVERLYKIGTTVEMKCMFNIERLFSTNPFDHPPNENIFFELFL